MAVDLYGPKQRQVLRLCYVISMSFTAKAVSGSFESVWEDTRALERKVHFQHGSGPEAALRSMAQKAKTFLNFSCRVVHTFSMHFFHPSVITFLKLHRDVFISLLY